MHEDKQLWLDTLDHLANKFNITIVELVEILCFCYSDTIKQLIRDKHWTVLLQLTKRRTELEKAINRTIPKLKELRKLTKLRERYHELDVDFVDGAGYDTTLTKVDGVWKQSRFDFEDE